MKTITKTLWSMITLTMLLTFTTSAQASCPLPDNIQVQQNCIQIFGSDLVSLEFTYGDNNEPFEEVYNELSTEGYHFNFNYTYTNDAGEVFSTNGGLPFGNVVQDQLYTVTISVYDQNKQLVCNEVLQVQTLDCSGCQLPSDIQVEQVCADYLGVPIVQVSFSYVDNFEVVPFVDLFNELSAQGYSFSFEYEYDPIGGPPITTSGALPFGALNSDQNYTVTISLYDQNGNLSCTRQLFFETIDCDNCPIPENLGVEQECINDLGNVLVRTQITMNGSVDAFWDFYNEQTQQGNSWWFTDTYTSDSTGETFTTSGAFPFSSLIPNEQYTTTIQLFDNFGNLICARSISYETLDCGGFCDNLDFEFRVDPRCGTNLCRGACLCVHEANTGQNIAIWNLNNGNVDATIEWDVPNAFTGGNLYQSCQYVTSNNAGLITATIKVYNVQVFPRELICTKEISYNLNCRKGTTFGVKSVNSNTTEGNSHTTRGIKEIAVFPNPSKDVITIANLGNVNYIVISDIMGKEKRIDVTDETMSVDLTDQSAGLYHISFYGAQNHLIKSKKLMHMTPY